ncbi:Ribosomal large subunit pseudouridine synthase C [Rickettsiales bacterium Ac37b]|nr:Ribosomal large subunit pseudouridine synthase C [Rickettsiales bacterium Ac37b]
MHFHQVLITEQEAGSRLDRVIRRQGITQAIIEKSLRKGLIKVNNMLALANDRLKEGDIINIDHTIKIQAPTSINHPQIDSKLLQQVKDSILYKDTNIIVLNKANNLAVQGGSKIKYSIDHMLDHLCFELSMRPKLVHRLDKETTGILLVARHAKAAAILAEHFKNKNIEKQYIAVIIGKPKNRVGKIVSTIDNSEALTHYKVLGSVNNEFSIVSLLPVTGKKHQLRIHCQLLGYPILGDKKYGVRSKKPLHLHAYKILLNNFMNNKSLEFIAPLPLYIQNMCELAGIKI